MLRRVPRPSARPAARVSTARGAGPHVAIVASRYNRRYVDAMLRAATEVLRRARAEVEVWRVPGAFEIPVAAARLARQSHHRPAVIICLGLVLRGETSHADHIGEAVTRALMQIMLQTELPVIHEVLVVDTPEQARARCVGDQFNRGAEAAFSALAMARLNESLDARVNDGSG